MSLPEQELFTLPEHLSSPTFYVEVIWLTTMYKTTLRKHLGSPPVFCGFRVVHHFSCLRCVRFYLVCFRPVSCVLNVASVFGFPLRSSLTFIQKKNNTKDSLLCHKRRLSKRFVYR
jgi:hypothetical protein